MNGLSMDHAILAAASSASYRCLPALAYKHVLMQYTEATRARDEVQCSSLLLPQNAVLQYTPADCVRADILNLFSRNLFIRTVSRSVTSLTIATTSNNSFKHMGNSASSNNTQRQQSIKDIATHNRQASQQQAAAYKAQQPRRRAEFPRRRSLELPDLLPLSQHATAQKAARPQLVKNPEADTSIPSTGTNATKEQPPPAWIPQPGTVSSPLIDAAAALQASYFPTVPATQATPSLKMDDGADLPAYNVAAVQKEEDSVESELTDTVLSWRGGGNDAQVRFGPGWKTSVPMTRSENDFVTCVKLSPGHHRIVFVVDNNWRVSDDLQTATDDDGLMVNYVEVPKIGDKTEHAKEINNTRIITPQEDDFIDLSHQDPTPSHEYTSEIPQMLVTYANLESSPPGSPQASHIPLPEPPMLPRQLERVVLNAQPPQVAPPSNHNVPHGGTLDDNSVLPIPNHVTLRHLTASAIRGGVLAVGTTTRYRRKFISTVYYTSID